jgi:hypothetical protein
MHSFAMRSLIMFCRMILLITVLYAAYGPVSAATLSVPAQYATIQGAIDAAQAGDIVVVSPGTYGECINFVGKAITVRSTEPSDPAVVAATVIDGGGYSSVVKFVSHETGASMLYGLTITHGAGEGELFQSMGGGILITSASPTIRGNLITSNSATFGAGIATQYGAPNITGNTISNNNGHGIACVSGAPAMTGNLIIGNSGFGFIVDGQVMPDTVATIRNCTIAGNGQGGVRIVKYRVTLLNSIIAASTGVNASNVYASSGSAVEISYCNVWGNPGRNYDSDEFCDDPMGRWGNISLDPLFADPAAGNYRLKSEGGRWNGSTWVADTATSRCIDAGDPSSDFVVEPTPNGGRVNMGFDGNTPYASKTNVPRIVAWGPKGTSVGVAANFNIAFSTDMARPTAQNALTINGVRASTFGGTFSWVGRKMTFKPTNNLQPGTEYKIIIAKGARSRAGVCMSRGFMWTFTTKPAAPAAVTVASAPTAQGAQIVVSLAAAADVTASIRNLAGREVAVIRPGRLDAGVHSLVWNGKSSAGTKVPAGVYVVQVSAKAADGTTCSAVISLRK